MKKVEHKFLKFYNVIIVGFLSILGFTTSCDKNPFQAVALYGTPMATFIVNGTVESEDANTPIENIRVIMQMDTAYTDFDGKYKVVAESFPSDQNFSIKFQDIDSTLNGEYQNLDTIVEFNNSEFTGSDGEWNEGETTTEFDVKLTPKK